jgi:hypothetical protein
MMAQATRDPIFWATVAVAEQDFDGAGDLCIRCHSVDGWINGRSTPTDGSGLQENDATGVACDVCHKVTNPDGLEHVGEQFSPFIANDEGVPPEGYQGSGQFVLWGSSDKLGPFTDAEARHQFMQSQYHRSVDFCGTCHDVSNPAVGDLAPNNGAQVPLGHVGQYGGPLEDKVALNYFPYEYGIVERTFSEYKAGLLSQTLISGYGDLPPDLQAGSIQYAYDMAMASTSDGNYADTTDRYFSCQSCHMPPVTGAGCNKNGAPIRPDLPLHDMTGGNYWMPDVIQYLDGLGQLRLGGGLTAVEIAALDAGKQRAMNNLSRAASLTVNGDNVRVTNLTAHKLISGYPEGRRMWLSITWYDANDLIVREDGAYGPLAVTHPVDGTPITVNTIIDLEDPNTKIYEAHYAMTQDWASGLLALHPGSHVLGFDRVTGEVEHTLGELAAEPAGSYEETFHFVLNNYVAKDNRIPTYGMSYDVAEMRNALPVPADQYGGSPGGVYQYWDDFALNPPAGATYATIDLLYQPTSWEYIQFLVLANTGNNAFLAEEGVNLFDAWLNTGMADPFVMTSATWGSPPVVVCDHDGICEPVDGEDCVSCPDDCISGGGAAACGNGICEPFDGEDCLTCPQDCNGKQSGNPDRQFCCGAGGGTGPVGCEDSRCNGDGFTCSDTVTPPYCCGDLICEGAEDSFNCEADCGPPVQACNDDGVCDPGEDCETCPGDCMGKLGGNPAGRYCCGNGVVEGPEGDGSICDGNF